MQNAIWGRIVSWTGTRVGIAESSVGERFLVRQENFRRFRLSADAREGYRLFHPDPCVFTAPKPGTVIMFEPADRQGIGRHRQAHPWLLEADGEAAMAAENAYLARMEQERDQRKARRDQAEATIEIDPVWLSRMAAERDERAARRKAESLTEDAVA